MIDLRDLFKINLNKNNLLNEARFQFFNRKKPKPAWPCRPANFHLLYRRASEILLLKFQRRKCLPPITLKM